MQTHLQKRLKSWLFSHLILINYFILCKILNTSSSFSFKLFRTHDTLLRVFMSRPGQSIFYFIFHYLLLWRCQWTSDGTIGRQNESVNKWMHVTNDVLWLLLPVHVMNIKKVFCWTRLTSVWMACTCVRLEYIDKELVNNFWCKYFMNWCCVVLCVYFWK